MANPRPVASETLVKFSSDGGTPCPLCKDYMLSGEDERFHDSADHLLRRHKLACLYIGQESHKTEKNQVWTDTVVIFGK
jgi:hypothetical protein